MANTAYINTQEDATIEGTNRLKSISESFLRDKEMNDGKIPPENRDCWGTLYINLLAQQRQLALTLSHMAKDFGK